MDQQQESLQAKIQAEKAYLQAKMAAEPTAEDIEKIAQICHEANRAVCVVNGDLSQPSWQDAPEWQKSSAREGVKFHIANPYASPRDSHDKWMETKLRAGWRYGAVKNPETKEHPCLLPHDSLPTSERMKDDIFKAVVIGYWNAVRRRDLNAIGRGAIGSAILANTQESVA